MLIPPKYFLSNKISRLLSKIEANKEVVESITIPAEIELNIRRKSTLRSSLFSARIEGNSVTTDEFPKLNPKDQRKIEINNILRAINWIFEKRQNREISVKDVLTLHSFIMKSIDEGELGKFRTKHEGIFTTSGIIVYHAPPPSQVKTLIDRLLKFTNSKKEEFVPIRAVLAHYIFEKIHPFADGSGRVGRLLMLMILKNGGYDFKGVMPFEEKIDKRRDSYYRMLEELDKDVSLYVEFMLEVVNEASEDARKAVLGASAPSPEDFLLPRRAEIYELIKGQKIINLDSIKRRFAGINERTLRYDLLKLKEAGFIQKLGGTRGAYYSSISSSFLTERN